MRENQFIVVQNRNVMPSRRGKTVIQRRGTSTPIAAKHTRTITNRLRQIFDDPPDGIVRLPIHLVRHDEDFEVLTSLGGETKQDIAQIAKPLGLRTRDD
ncbi:hypothetical protein DM56_4577 [Burkholderia mallei]|nr:hypothetical protein DM45_671 [Burkholderia mallei]KOT05061.1 hypothetical protein DM56_4577 [Burkholderia mallei]